MICTNTEYLVPTFSDFNAAGGSSTQNRFVSSASTAATAAPLLCFSPIDRATSSLAPKSFK